MQRATAASLCTQIEIKSDGQSSCGHLKLMFLRKIHETFWAPMTGCGEAHFSGTFGSSLLFVVVLRLNSGHCRESHTK